MKRHQAVIDVAELPTIVFGRRAITWWGTVFFMVIEGSTLVVCAVAYLYLRKNFHHWPPSPSRLPDLLLPTIGAVFLALTNIPVYWLHKASRRMDKDAVRKGLLLMAAFGTVAVGIRIMGFRSLNVHWDTNAYASVAWLTVSFHTTLLLFEAIETWVFVALFWFGSVEGKHFTDVEDNCAYWYFMTLVWLPVYALVFWSPRLL